jgi:hypothetical protein
LGYSEGDVSNGVDIGHLVHEALKGNKVKPLKSGRDPRCSNIKPCYLEPRLGAHHSAGIGTPTFDLVTA